MTGVHRRHLEVLGRDALSGLIVVAAYIGAARLGLSLTYSHARVTSVWAPAGIALAAVWLGGYRMLPAVATGSLIAVAVDGNPFWAVIAVTVGDTVGVTIKVWLLRRCGFDSRLERVRDVLMLVALGAFASTALSTTLGVGSLWLTHAVPSSQFWSEWRLWWMAEVGGSILVGSALLALSSVIRTRASRRQLVDGLVLGSVLAAVAVLVFRHDSPLAYLPFPVLILLALQYRQMGASLGGLVLSVIAVYFAVRGHGPFAGGSPSGSLIRAETFVNVATVTALLVAAARSERWVAERALKQLAVSERALAEAQRLTNIGSFEWDATSDHTAWSDELYRILGRDPATYPATYESWLACVHEDDRERVNAIVRQSFEQGGSYTFQHRAIRGDGSLRTVECHGQVVIDGHGRPAAVHGTSQDVTAFKLAEERFRSLLESAPDAIVIVDEDGQVVLVNSRTEEMFGYSRRELIGQDVERLVPPRYGERHFRHRDSYHKDPHTRPMGAGKDLYARHKDGTEFPVEISLAPIETEQGRLVSAAVRDVTERKLAADALAHQASHDPLTGLPNRNHFLDRLDHALARARRGRTKLAVLFLDLDDFKLVNDTRGHEAGDLLLLALTPRLTAALRPGDTVARFGGDEFVVLCEDLVTDSAAMSIAKRIADACAAPVRIGDYEHVINVSTGVVIVDGGASTPSNVLRDADAAMYRAKGAGKGRIEVFDEGMRAKLIERMAIESALRRALDNHELRIFYQPVVSLETNQIVGVEALLRWQHPVRGLLEPAEFMAVAESSGLIIPIGEWVLEEACRQAVLWRDRGPGSEPIKLSVNLSPRQVARSNVVAMVQRVLRNTGLEPELLDLEITENSLLEDGEASELALRELKEVGVRVVLDDFGTGYSSLSYLKRFTIDALKIDRSFVDGLGEDRNDGAIVNAVVSMAQALDVGVTAEGVETPTQLMRLREHGCPFAQGYLFSRPAPADEMTDLLLGADAGLEPELV